MSDPEKPNEISAKAEEAAALKLVGAFLFVLGCAMVVAAYWPPTWIGKLTNLFAAVVLLGIGLAMIWRARSVRREPPRDQP